MYGVVSCVWEKEIKWKFGEFEGSVGVKFFEVIFYLLIFFFSVLKGYL